MTYPFFNYSLSAAAAEKQAELERQGLAEQTAPVHVNRKSEAMKRRWAEKRAAEAERLRQGVDQTRGQEKGGTERLTEGRGSA